MSNQLVTFKQNLRNLTEKKELALPSNVKPEAFQNAAIVAVQDNPQILDCSQESVFKSIRTLAAAGLVPDGREAALVPFFAKGGKVCQAMPMVFGLVKMVRRSGEVTDIRAHIVYQKEFDAGRFNYVAGDEEILTHEPILFGDRGKPIACYAVACLKDGNFVREIMSAEDIDKVRRSGASQRVGKGQERRVSDTPVGIWKDWWEEMWRKTVIRRLCKRLDMSSEDMRRVMVEPDFEHMRDVSPPEPGKFAEKAKAARGDTDAPEEHSADPEVNDDVLDGEIVEEGFSIDDLDLSEAFPGSDEFTEGAKAFTAGMKIEMCPHKDDRKKATDWCGGWTQSKGAAE